MNSMKNGWMALCVCFCLPATAQVTGTGAHPQSPTVTQLHEGQDTSTRPTKTANLREVLVSTGATRAISIRENPIAISSVPARKIDRATEANLVDALVKQVPGLSAVKTGPNISKPFIRGLGYNRVLTLYDGVRQEGQQWGDEHGLEVDNYNVQRAEVVKGPASLMFGSDALAGVVSLFPHVPTQENGRLHGRWLSEYQANNGLIGNGLRLGQHKASWLWEVRGAYRIAKNYKNKTDGPVYLTGFRETNASAMAGYTNGNSYTYLNATLYNNLQGIPDGSRDSLTRRFTRQVAEGAGDDIKHRPIVPDAWLRSYTLSPLHQHIQHYRVYANGHYQLGRSLLDAGLGWQQNIRREYNHPQDVQQAGLFVKLTTLHYSLRYALPPLHAIEITLGSNGMYQQNRHGNATDFPIPDYRLLDAGAYVFAKWKSGRWTLSGGLRYDLRSLRSHDFYLAHDARTGYLRPSKDTVGAVLQFPALGQSFTGISLSAGATCRLNDVVSLKANMAKGYRAPNITEIASNGLDPGAHIVYLGNRNFVPETSLQEDLGVLLDGAGWEGNVSVFNNQLSHYIFLQQVPEEIVQGNKTYRYMQSKAWLYGLEAAVALHPVAWKGWHWDNSLALTYGYNRDDAYRHAGLQGAYLPFIPPLQWHSEMGKEWVLRHPILPSLHAGADLEYAGAQNRYLALDQTETATRSYALVGIQIGGSICYRRENQFQWQFQVNNLLDATYQSNLSRLKYFEYYGASPNGRSGIYGMGRNITVKIILPF
ncbi:TonB-dependent receptor [Chitinophaga parva]|uniref:TonB-dependent receptor n=2 Tax=Chitinophaga parva TaxID=2169414 RepID=A0A2T7BCV9_9BACT|nr:TonB-dependent receptor [Chitinophaga parva]